MKIKINKNVFLKAIKICHSIINQNSLYPVLQSILIEAKENKILIKGSNGTNSILYKIDNEIEILSEGTTLIKSKTLFDLVYSLEDDSILLENKNNKLLKIKSDNFDAKINIMKTEEYPNLKFELDNPESLILPIEKIAEINKKVSPSVNTNIEKESVFNGVLFDSKSESGKLKIIATDTYKLSFLNYDFDGSKIKMIIDPLILKIILEFKNNEITFLKKDNRILIKLENISILTKNFEGNFPSIENIINQDFKSDLVLNKDKLIRSLNRGLSLIINENKPIANIVIQENIINLNFKSNEIGSAFEEKIVKTNNIKKIEFDININYLISILKPFENDEINLFISDTNKPLKFEDSKDKNFLQILVPLRKNKESNKKWKNKTF